MQFILQTAQPEAAQRLSSLALKAYPKHYEYLWENGDTSWYVTKCFLPEVFLAELNDANSAFYIIATEQNEALGFLKLNINAPLQEKKAADCLELERIYLLDNATGKGVGTAALQFIENEARRLGKKHLWLKVMDSSEAIRFYQKNGFEICDTYTLDYERIKVELRGMFYMKKALS
jgi:GNAT superfamily N-acetyltransferase